MNILSLSSLYLLIVGLEWNNPDLEENYNKAGSWDFNGNDDDPMPDGTKGISPTPHLSPLPLLLLETLYLSGVS